MSEPITSESILPHGATGGGAAVSATCPLCHTRDLVVTPDALRAGADWACARCGQQWNAARLERMAAYAIFDAAH